MPTYTIKDPTSGKTLSLTGDSPPTEAELEDVFAKVNATAPRQEMNFAIVNGQRVPLGADEADVMPRPAKPPSTLGELMGGVREGIRTSPFGDSARGALAGMANSVYGAGDLVRRATGMNRIADTPVVKRLTTAPDTPEGRQGFLTEQGLEFMVPTGVLGKGAKAAEIAKAAGLTAAQTGGDPLATGASAALTAVLPGGATVNKAGASLKESARETMANSLYATKEWAKAEAERLAPEMLTRGIGGSIKQLRGLATGMAERVGKNLNAAYQAAAAAGSTVPGDVIRRNIEYAIDSLHTVGASGQKVIVPGNEAAIAQLTHLKDFVSDLKLDIPVDQAATIKQQFDDIIERAGLFGPKAMASASEKAQGWSFKKASDAIRTIINQDPTLEKLNQEVRFWIGLRDVSKATSLRRVGQGSGLTAALAGSAGAGAGATTGAALAGPAGGTVGATVGAVAGHQLARLFKSPRWMNTVSAPMKNALADALASGSAARITYAVQRIMASLPAAATRDTSPPP